MVSLPRKNIVERIANGAGNYFAAPKAKLRFLPSGCKTLDLALGGGWAEARIANVVGDKSTGKTLLCIEAVANFAQKYPKGHIEYKECESAFDTDYAAALGMPIDRVRFEPELDTVEDLFEDLARVIDRGRQSKSKTPTLYIVDSLDALSDRDEMKRGISEPTFGTGKARTMSQLFRRLKKQVAETNVTLLIVSQIRSKIDAVTYGRKTTRTGGRAMDFYASQVIYLSHVKTLVRTVHGIKRVTGISIKAKCDKNKVALPLREAEFNIKFGYGIDDAAACVTWLKQAKYLSDMNIKSSAEAEKDYLAELSEMSDGEYTSEMQMLRSCVERRWYEIERSFLPTRKKYG